MLHHPNEPSEARRLTDVLRSASEPGVRYTDNWTPLDERPATLQMVLEGAVLRQRFLSDGRRQTVAVYYRDDVVNLQGYVGRPHPRADYLVALSGTQIGYVKDEGVRRMRAEAPAGQDGIAALVFRELGIAQERIQCLGQRTALEQVAHFFCETMVRCVAPRGNPKLDRCIMNMTQELLSTVLGLSTVHVNRILRELRQSKLAELIGGELTIHDFDGLARLGEFDDAYLAPI